MAAALRNPARDRLEKGELSLGIGLRQTRTVDIAPAMKACGYDWLFIDLEHNSMDLDMAVQISVAALAAGIAPIVRVPARQYWMATRVLDGGAIGIVMPHVDTPEEARDIAAALRYPPQGHRSVAGGLPHFNYVPMSIAETCAAMNEALLVTVLIETPRAVENARLSHRHRRVPRKRQMGRARRHQRRGADPPLCRDGRAHGAWRQRSRLSDERRQRAREGAARPRLKI